ncbi:GntR family transcriptional regulator [Clostridium fermenticellae]|uniref:GntR family transcriptional regulator n=1 Tax=Clostridium fermenticellae TaxID=2068654 RepID=A0A386H4C3_9CLOT|nr:GntR family transcriptional regulator [Clostridium fermenticellae]AYD40383.1 GntR family transcriptional regulator [Clostridium fermenticellae]
MANYESLRDIVYKYISDKIQNGELQANEKISESSICKDLSISRTPAREALIQLAADNLIEYAPRRGFFVKEVSLKEKLDLYAVLACLDGYAATLAMDKLNDDDYKEMEHIVKEIDKTIKDKDYKLYNKLQFEFHNIYVSKCDNEKLKETLSGLEHSFIPVTYSNKNTEVLFKILKDVNKEHTFIIELFKKKESEKLEYFLREVHWAAKYLDMV